MTNSKAVLCLVFGIGLSLLVGVGQAQVARSANDSFQIKITKMTKASPEAAYQGLVNVAKWWDADHSYSGKAENMSMDLEKHCLLEKLEKGGFCRHMEIVFCQPGKTLRMTGGLGPLQEMGVNGVMSFNFKENGDQTEILFTYNVLGNKAQQLDKIAPAVAAVLNGQLDRLKKYCDQVATP